MRSLTPLMATRGGRRVASVDALAMRETLVSRSHFASSRDRYSRCLIDCVSRERRGSRRAECAAQWKRNFGRGFRCLPDASRRL